ncbi:type IV pilin-like G/H family protein [Allocoleopsis sp.]|uniref:type IV pilin-like G/H family protein n=1 Tax=Allocoleopsis sp. TaxID=3088169 RepID=UPI002FD4CE18
MSHLVSNLATGSHRVRPLQRLWVPGLMAKGLFVVLLGTLGTPVSAQPPMGLAVTQTQEAAESNAVIQQLRGQWQTKDPTTGKVIKFIFAPDGNLFTVLPAPDGSSVAIKFGYKINSTTQPMQLDMIVSPEQVVQTIFELTPQGKLHLQLEGLSAGERRPTQFNAASTLFDKVSDVATVPKDVRVIALETQNTNSGQSVVKQFLTILSQAQQAYYLKNGKFAADVEELKIATNLETQDYRYQIVPQKDNTQSVMITAIAKNAGLPSYTSAVFATKVNGKTTTTARICATEKPSTSPPTMPAPPASGSLDVLCPAGSRVLP